MCLAKILCGSEINRLPLSSAAISAMNRAHVLYVGLLLGVLTRCLQSQRSLLLALCLQCSVSRAALELENLALRHQLGVLQAVREKTPEIDPSGPPNVGLAVAPLAGLAFGSGHRQARNRRGRASCRLSLVLDLEGAAANPEGR